MKLLERDDEEELVIEVVVAKELIVDWLDEEELVRAEDCVDDATKHCSIFVTHIQYPNTVGQQAISPASGQQPLPYSISKYS